MKLIGVVLVLLSADALATSPDALAEPGTYILVRGSIEGCPEFPGILAHQKVDPRTELQFFDLRPIATYLRTSTQIQEELASLIANRAGGKEPKSLRIEFLPSESDFKLMQPEIVTSYRFLASDRCLHPQHTPWEPLQKPRELLELKLPNIALLSDSRATRTTRTDA